MFSLIGMAIKGGFDLVMARQKTKAKKEENTQRLLENKDGNNHEWEMASLVDKDRWLRRVSFALFSIPFVVGVFNPEAVSRYFEVALAAVPEWYIQIYVTMVGGVWGVSALKNALPGLVGGVAKAVRK